MKRRKHTKASEWLPIIEAWKKSGLTKKQFCQQNDISYKTFYRWYYQLHKFELNVKAPNKTIAASLADFIPVTVSSRAGKAQTSEQHGLLLFNDTLKLQIPIEAINTDFLQMLITASGAQSC